MRPIIFIGGIGSPEQFGGELTKNKFLINALHKRKIRVIDVDTHGARKRPWRLARIFTTLITHPKSDVIISTSLGNIYWLVKLFYRCKTKRKICYFGIGGSFPKHTINGDYDRKILHIFNTIVVEGRNMQKELKQCGLDSIVVPNFKKIDYLPDLSLTRKPSEKTRFVFMSRLHPEKGVGLIIDCVKRLNADGQQDCFLVDFYGGFEEEDYKKEVLDKLSNLANAKYKGKLDLMKNDGFDTLSSYDIMLFPTFWNGEGFPGVVIDAYISGLPLIASDWSINTEFIEDGKTGIIIPNQNADALYEAMKLAIENKKRFIDMAATCQKKSWKYDTDNVLTDDLFNKILNVHKI